MEDLKKIIIYSKLKEIDGLVSDNRVKELLSEYKIDFEAPDNHFTCIKCDNVKHNDNRYSEMFGYERRYFNRCIDCQDRHMARRSLTKSLYGVETPLQIRLKFIDVSYYYRYGQRIERMDYVDEICDICVDNKVSDGCEKKCPYKRRIRFLCDIVNNDISNKIKKIESIITDEHVEFKKITVQLKRKIKNLRNS